MQATKTCPGGHEGQDPLLLTVNEAASLLGCHKVTVYRLIYQGRLQVCRAFRSLRIPRKEVERLVADVEPYGDARSRLHPRPTLRAAI